MKTSCNKPCFDPDAALNKSPVGISFLPLPDGHPPGWIHRERS